MPATFTAICGLQMARLHVSMGNLKSPRSALGLNELKCASRFRRRVYNTFRRPLTSDTRFTQSSPRLPFGLSHLTVVLFVLFELDRLIIQDCCALPGFAWAPPAPPTWLHLQPNALQVIPWPAWLPSDIGGSTSLKWSISVHAAPLHLRRMAALPTTTASILRARRLPRPAAYAPPSNRLLEHGLRLSSHAGKHRWCGDAGARDPAELAAPCCRATDSWGWAQPESQIGPVHAFSFAAQPALPCPRLRGSVCQAGPAQVAPRVGAVPGCGGLLSFSIIGKTCATWSSTWRLPAELPK